ncbi:MAG: hypothetical protein GTN93_32530 [Anaerolineae bacterium]|nr:hypothetical protein [Anaerolineae bacterium]
MTNDANSEDPLRQLLVDADEIDKQALAGVLKGRVSIDSTSGRLVLMPGYSSLDARRKVLAVLLARKAAHLLGLADTEAFTNAEVTQETGLRPGTAAPSLRSLKELLLVDQDGDRAYYIPNPQLASAIGFIGSQT